MKKRIFFGILLVAIFTASLFFWRASFSQKKKLVEMNSAQNLQTQQVVQSDKANNENYSNDNQIKIEDNKQKQGKQAKQIKVPFTSQAPFGDWSDEKNQNGCEEASVAMAMRWLKNEKFSSPSDAQQEIANIAKFEEKTFGNFIDASVEDVGKIFSQYYGYENFTISRDVTLSILKSELEKGNIILVPAFGRALKNPNYTQPGPITHMLVIVGYDAKTKEFITNDPGTKRGENYRYDENVLFDAVWAYPAGEDHPAPPKNTSEKVMLVVDRGR